MDEFGDNDPDREVGPPSAEWNSQDDSDWYGEVSGCETGLQLPHCVLALFKLALSCCRCTMTTTQTSLPQPKNTAQLASLQAPQGQGAGQRMGGSGPGCRAAPSTDKQQTP